MYLKFVHVHVGSDGQNQLIKPQRTIYQRLANIVANDSRVEAVRKAFDLYQSCMDAATIDKVGINSSS